jgi:hypothetical protein
MRHKWEYWTRYEAQPLGVEDLNAEGEKAWELVSVTYESKHVEPVPFASYEGTYGNRWYYVFKRIRVGSE